MPALTRVLFNVLCKDLSASVTFYQQLLDLETTYESDWFVTLSPKGQPEIVIGLIDQVSQFTPRHAWGMHEGTYLTFVVDDVYDVLERARELGAEVVSEPVALDYGQTRALICDLNGMVLDISTPTELLAGRDEGGVETGERSESAEPGSADENRWARGTGLRH
jgi:predicted enzyme related to lactoylglutathione lyase